MNKITGKKGEIIAEKYLKKHKYKILYVNYENKIGEIDIIASKNNLTVFVEVKSRSSLKFGHPKEAVTSFKQHKIRQVATAYMQKNNLLNSLVRFDVIEIINDQLNHIENAF